MMLSIVLVSIGVGALAGIIAALVALGRSSNNTQLEGGKRAAALPSPEQQQKLREARQRIFEAKTAANRIKNPGICEAGREAAAKAERVVATMGEQPDEIRRANQFFAYYLPTLVTVLRKYSDLEAHGMAGNEQVSQTQEYLADMAHAFDMIYGNLFKDDELDLSVEIEAMQAALKRDGVL